MTPSFLQALIAELLGCAVIWAKQNSPKPAKPFATIDLMGARGEGIDEVIPTDTPGLYQVRGPREDTLAVEYFGMDAETKLRQLEQALQRPTIIDRCFGNGVAFFDAAGVQDLSRVLDDAKWEERAALDLFIRFAQTTLDTPGYISTVNLTMNETDTFTVSEDEEG